MRHSTDAGYRDPPRSKSHSGVRKIEPSAEEHTKSRRITHSPDYMTNPGKGSKKPIPFPVLLEVNCSGKETQREKRTGGCWEQLLPST